jgi:hypothetical protein
MGSKLSRRYSEVDRKDLAGFLSIVMGDPRDCQNNEAVVVFDAARITISDVDNSCC